jgi:D-alanyl-D-alanine carboxypeptidase
MTFVRWCVRMLVIWLAAIVGIPQSGAPVQSPAPAGASLEARVDMMVGRQMTARHIPGLSLGVVRDGTLILARGYGDATLEWKQPATPDTVYLLASLTKQFTATAIILLANEGRLRLDEPLATYVSGTPASWSGITIRHLLTHTAGLKDRFELTPQGRMFMDYTSVQMLDAAEHTATDAPPGAMWQYSDQGYFLLGLVIQQVSGKSYGQFLRERIFDPIGMAATSLHDWAAIVPGRADEYAWNGSMLTGSRRRYQFGVVSHYGVQSTVLDLARYDAALSAGKIASPATLQQMWTPARLNDNTAAELAGIGYGFGWFLERFNAHREVYHGGSTGTCLYRLPDDGLSTIVLTNLEQTSGSDPCGIARMVAAQYVPAIAIVSVPAKPDPDTARGQRLRGILEALALGVAEPGEFTAAAFPVIKAAAAQQAVGFKELGAIQSFELIADDTLVSEVVQYRVRYANATIHLRFVLDGAGRIASMTAR